MSRDEIRAVLSLISGDLAFRFLLWLLSRENAVTVDEIVAMFGISKGSAYQLLVRMRNGGILTNGHEFEHEWYINPTAPEFVHELLGLIEDAVNGDDHDL